MPYDSYRLYQIERAKSPAEVQRADEQAAGLISALSSLLRSLIRPVRAIWRPSPRPLRSASPPSVPRVPPRTTPGFGLREGPCGPVNPCHSPRHRLGCLARTRRTQPAKAAQNRLIGACHASQARASRRIPICAKPGHELGDTRY